MKGRTPYLTPQQSKTVRDWWEALQPRDIDQPKPSAGRFSFDRGDRARLRRGTNPDDLMLARAAYVLARELDRSSVDSDGALADMAEYERVAIAAGVLAQVREDAKDGKTLLWHLGLAATKGADAQPLLNEIRFKRLLKASSPADAHMQLVRAVKIAGNKIDVAQLANDVLALLDQMGSVTVAPARNVKLHWAHDYYLTAKDQKALATVQDKEPTA
ncbi:hypothetical protein GCM10025795_09920 [Verticiella sediminum]